MTLTPWMRRALVARGANADLHHFERMSRAQLDVFMGIEGAADPAWLAEALRLKDEMGLKELAEHLGVGIDDLSAEFSQRGIRRRYRLSGGRPQEATVAPTSFPSDVADEDDGSGGRPGSKDAQIERFLHLVGHVPDAEVARKADVSVRTLASYRARHNIAGYTGPRRRPQRRGPRASKVDDFRDLLGHVPDRVVADIAGMSLGAVRNYRIKLDREPAGRIPRREILRLVNAWREKLMATGVSDPLIGVSSPVLAPLITRLARQAVAAASTSAGPVSTGTAAESPMRALTPISDSRAWRIKTIDGINSHIVVARGIHDALMLASGALGGEHHILAIEDLGEVLSTS